MTTRSRALRRRRRPQDVEPIYEAIGATIKAVREGKGATVKDVADAIGVSRQHMTRWEAGTETRIPLHKLYELADHWGTTIDVFSVDIGGDPVTFHLAATPADIAALRRLSDQGDPS